MTRPDRPRFSLFLALFTGSAVLFVACKKDPNPPPMPLFEPVLSYQVEEEPRGLVVGDFTGDGIDDLVVCHQFNASLALLEGTGNGQFAAPAFLPTGSIRAVAIASADVDRDGNPDLALSPELDENIAILFGDGAGGFTAPLFVPSDGYPQALAIKDLTGNGHLDLIASVSPPTQPTGDVEIFLGDGQGNFVADVIYPIGSNVVDLAVADIDVNGSPDLVALDQQENTVTVLWNAGDGSFDEMTVRDTGDGANGVTIGDFNGDGLPDLATANIVGGTVNVFYNNGFDVNPGHTVNTCDNSFGIAAADLNRDGAADLAVTCSGTGWVEVLMGQLTSAPAPVGYLVVPEGDRVGRLAAADLNGDEFYDLIVLDRGAGGGAGSVHVFRSEVIE